MNTNKFTWGNLLDAFYVLEKYPDHQVLTWPKPKREGQKGTSRAEQRTQVLAHMMNIPEEQLKMVPIHVFSQTAQNTIIPYSLIVVRYHTPQKQIAGKIKEGAYIDGQHTIRHILDEIKYLEQVHEQNYGYIDAIWEEPSVCENVLILCVRFSYTRQTKTNTHKVTSTPVSKEPKSGLPEIKPKKSKEEK